MSGYETRTIDMACFYVEEGMYSIAELEQMLEDFKKAKEIQGQHLKKATGEQQ